MKKRMRMMTCLMLVALMVATMAIPTMAKPKSDSGVLNGYAYSWTITHEDDFGQAYISVASNPTYVTALVQIQTYYELTGKRFQHNPISVTGYSNVAALDNDVIESINGVPVSVTVKGVKGAFSINSTSVTDGYYMGSWYKM